MSYRKKANYLRKVLPGGTLRALSAPVRGPVHLLMAIADHFEPAVSPEGGAKRVPRPEQERRLEFWVREYPKTVDRWRDHDGRPLPLGLGRNRNPPAPWLSGTRYGRKHAADADRIPRPVGLPPPLPLPPI